MVEAALGLAMALVAGTEPLGAGELELTPATPNILLGSDARVSIELRGPADLSEVRVTTNHGAIAQLHEVEPGHWQLELVAPPQTWPQVAIVAAEGHSGGRAVYGVRAIPMWGSGEARVRTRPGAEVTVTIAGKSYGPIRADSRGIGIVPVEIPTGVRQGFSGGKALDLGLPRSSLVHVSLQQTSVPAYAPAEVSARIYAVKEDGGPAATAPSARATLGEVSAPQRIAPGVFEVRWSLPASEPGEASFSAWLTGGAAPAASAMLRLLAGPPATLAVEVSPDRVIAGEPRQLRVAVAVADSHGNPTDASVDLHASLGIVGPLERTGTGQYQARLEVPDHFGGASAAKLRATAGPASAEQQVSLVPGPAERVELAPAQATLVSDGTQTLDVRATVVDRFGNPVAVPLTAAAGKVTPEGRGRFLVRYTPPRSLRARSSALEISAAGLTSRAELRLLAAPARLTLAPKLGMASNLGAATAPSAAVEGGAWTRLFDQNAGALAEAGWFLVARQGVIDRGALAGRPASVIAHFVPLTASVAWWSPVGEALWLRASAGGGATLISSSAEIDGQPAVVEGQLVPSANASLAIGCSSVGPGAPFAEARLWWHGRAGTSNNLDGALVLLSLTAGYRFDVR